MSVAGLRQSISRVASKIPRRPWQIAKIAIRRAAVPPCRGLTDITKAQFLVCFRCPNNLFIHNLHSTGRRGQRGDDYLAKGGFLFRQSVQRNRLVSYVPQDKVEPSNKLHLQCQGDRTRPCRGWDSVIFCQGWERLRRFSAMDFQRPLSYNSNIRPEVRSLVAASSEMRRSH